MLSFHFKVKMKGALVLVCLSLSLSYSFGQKKCGSIGPDHDHLESWISQRLASRISNITEKNQQEEILTIPVVVHVLHQGESIGTDSNLSEERITQQIDSLNADFRRLNADAVNTPAVFESVVADVAVEFMLAQQDPLGEPTNGIVRVNANNSYLPSLRSDIIEMRSLSHWPAENYLNIYVSELRDSFVGFASFPESDIDKNIIVDEDRLYLDAIFVDFQYFGTNPDAPAYESRGRTLTHEVGHFLGLRHIWGDGGCSRDDYIDDTPLASGHHGGYTSPCTFPDPESTNNCIEGEPAMFQNYMDYTDDICMNLFTQGQKACMRVVAENSPRRASLSSSLALNPLDLSMNDLSITEVISPQQVECDAQVTAVIEVTNHGLNTIDQFSVSLAIDGLEVASQSQNVTLLPYENALVSFPSQTIAEGAQVVFSITEVNNTADGNADNDIVSVTISYLSSITLPFVQTFEEGNEMLGNFGEDQAWNTAIAPHASPSNNALVFQSFDNNLSFGNDLKITTPSLDLTGVSNATMTFKYAYSGTPSGIYDGLIVRASTNCGITYSQILFSEVGSDLQTAIPTDNEFAPFSDLDWNETTIDLSSYQNTDGLRIQFEGLNGSNNIYLDDIRIAQENILENDIILSSLDAPVITCDEAFDLNLEVRNAGINPITSFSLSGTVNEVPYSQDFNDFSIAFQESYTVPITSPTLFEPINTINLNVVDVNGEADLSLTNNDLEVFITVDSSRDSYPLNVNFEIENDWVITSPSEAPLWEVWTDTNTGTNSALKASIFDAEITGVQSWFVSPLLATGGLDSAMLSFKISYANRVGFNDQFRILYSSDCGESFDNVLFEANSDLIAVSGSEEQWIPESDSDWRFFLLDISETLDYADDIRIAFVVVNGNGNDLYLDDINIVGNALPEYEELFRVYPNPTNPEDGHFKLSLNLPEKDEVTVQIVSMSGQLIFSQEIANAFNQIIAIETPTHSGLYIVRVIGDNFIGTQKLFVDSN